MIVKVRCPFIDKYKKCPYIDNEGYCTDIECVPSNGDAFCCIAVDFFLDALKIMKEIKQLEKS